MEDSPLKMIVIYDAENVAPIKAPNIQKFLNNLGTIVETFAYGDYSIMPNAYYWGCVVKYIPMRYIHTPHNGKHEVADQYIMADVDHYLYQYPGCAIVIVSSDADYSKLSYRLKIRGVTVIGVGKKELCKKYSAWVSSCNEFYFIEDIKDVIPVKFPPPKKKNQPKHLSNCPSNKNFSSSDTMPAPSQQPEEKTDHNQKEQTEKNASQSRIELKPKTEPNIVKKADIERQVLTPNPKIGPKTAPEPKPHSIPKRKAKPNEHSDVGGSFIKMVKIPGQDYYIGRYQVTQEEYLEIMGENPSHFKGDNLPVEMVSWNDAMAFCEILTMRERQNGRLPNGYKYTLPTSKQWGIACRAGTTTRYYSGDSEGSLDKVAWWMGNSGQKTHPVGTKYPNDWGIYDMHGNVDEWCLDERACDRALRGGGYWSRAGGCVSMDVGSRAGSDDRLDCFGFRVALVPDGTAMNDSSYSRSNSSRERESSAPRERQESRPRERKVNRSRKKEITYNGIPFSEIFPPEPIDEVIEKSKKYEKSMPREQSILRSVLEAVDNVAKRKWRSRGNDFSQE